MTRGIIGLTIPTFKTFLQEAEWHLKWPHSTSNISNSFNRGKNLQLILIVNAPNYCQADKFKWKHDEFCWKGAEFSDDIKHNRHTIF